MRREHATTPRTVLADVGVVACLALAGRRRWPETTLPVCLGASLGALVLSGTVVGFTSLLAVAVYTVALRRDRRRALVAGAGTSLLCAGVGLLAGGLDPQVVAVVSWLSLAAALGDGVRTRRAYVQAVEDRAERAERTREEEARRRVAEKRLSIARELHDAIAHHVTVINAQAQLGRHLLQARQAGAEDALDAISTASRTLLEEFRRLLGVLRPQDGTAATTAPSPTIEGLDALVESFSAAGLRVTVTRRGRPRPVAAALDLVTYRVVQEALTNAQRYGTGVASLTLEYGSEELNLRRQPRRPGRPRGAAPLRHGLVGIRERAAAVGGVAGARLLDPRTYRMEEVLPLDGART